MSRSDALAVGLKLLGAFFLITGLAEVGYAVYHLATVREAIDFRRQFYDPYHALIRAGITTIGGLWLLLTADYYGEGKLRKAPPREPEK
jgi:hypothetical protein